MTTEELLAYVVLGILALFLVSGLWFIVIQGLVG
jgi:hypothetical protein